MTFTVHRPEAGTAPLVTADELPPLGHFVDGQFVVDRSTEPGTDLSDIVNPATEEVLARVGLGGVEDTDRAVEAARVAHPAWARITPKERAEVLVAIAERVEANADLLVRLESADSGKPFAVARDDVDMTADGFRFMAGALRTQSSSMGSGEYVADHTSLILREPLGVIGAVTPWNYPLLMGAWKIAPILAAGNCLVLKPSEQTPLSTLKFAELVADILPSGVFNVVTGRGPVVGDRLARHPDIAMIALTGSTGSGRAVARAAADTVKRAHLELGGKAPFVVFQDADLAAAAAGLRTGGFWNSGQECGAACRVLVHASVAEEFTAHLVREVEQITIGDSRAGDGIEIGPLVSRQHYDRVRGYLDRAVAEGARPVTGGAAIEGDKPGYFVPPTVLAGVAEGAEITREEVFGPVVSIETFADEDEAIRRANDVDAGLAASVWTENARRSHTVAARLDAGTVWVNSHLVLANELPWGGFKGSGYGRDLSVLALEDYSRTKHVMHHHGTAGSVRMPEHTVSVLRVRALRAAGAAPPAARFLTRGVLDAERVGNHAVGLARLFDIDQASARAAYVNMCRNAGTCAPIPQGRLPRIWTGSARITAYGFQRSNEGRSQVSWRPTRNRSAAGGLRSGDCGRPPPLCAAHGRRENRARTS